MRRLSLLELHDFAWCPKAIRDGLTDFLEISIEVLDTYGPVRPLIEKVLLRSGSSRVVDLCSGAGGPWVHWVKKGLIHSEVLLTDKFPNKDAAERLAHAGIPGLAYCTEPVDATNVPVELTGFRTVFTAFHHFPPEQAEALIADAVSRRQPIGIFELTSCRLKTLLWMLLSPLGVWAFTPRMPKIGWKKCILTYLIPVIPLVVTIDGIASCFRSYSLAELKKMASAAGYKWFIGQKKGGGGPVTYVVGYPTQNPLKTNGFRGAGHTRSTSA